MAEQEKTFMLAEDYREKAMASNTKTAYEKDLARFRAWGGTIPSTVDQICAYLSEHATTHKASTLQRWRASLSVAHRLVLPPEVPPPTKDIKVSRTLAGIKRERGAKKRRVEPAVKEIIAAMVDKMPEGLVGLRNKAILLIGFAGAMRRSEVVGLKVQDLRFIVSGIIVSLGSTKSDQAAEHDEIGIPYAKGTHCPVLAVKEWIKAAGIKDGPLFRAIRKNGSLSKKPLSAVVVAQIVKKAAVEAGLDPELFAGHSLRAGLITSAAREDKPLHKIQAQSRHRDLNTLVTYIRDAGLFDDNAAGVL